MNEPYVGLILVLDSNFYLLTRQYGLLEVVLVLLRLLWKFEICMHLNNNSKFLFHHQEQEQLRFMFDTEIRAGDLLQDLCVSKSGH